MTNQQGAPEALANFDAAVAAVLQCIGTAPCNSHEICTGFAANTRKRLAALVEAQQPATHVQNPAGIEHVVGDVSKNGAESNMAQQPAPLTAAAGQRRSDLVPGVMHCAKCKFQLNRITLCVSDGNAYAGNNETEPCPNGCGPLWPVTWEQEARNCWKALEEMHERLHPAPTPQADSQPAPHSEPWYGHQFKEVRRGYWQCSCGKAIAEAVPNASKDSYPPLPNRYAYDDDGGEMFTADHMRAYVDSDRAARAPADSVLEDAARLDWLALAGPTSICLVIDRPHDGEVEVATDDVTGYGKTLREAIDAAMNKGGA